MNGLIIKVFSISIAVVTVVYLIIYNLDSRKRDEDTTSRIAANP